MWTVNVTSLMVHTVCIIKCWYIYFYVFITDYFEETAKSSQIEEIHIYGGNGFLQPIFLLKYKELFTRIETLTIDPKERYRGRKFLDDFCDDNLWEIGQLIEILEFIASITHINIWKFKIELMEGKPPKEVSFQVK